MEKHVLASLLSKNKAWWESYELESDSTEAAVGSPTEEKIDPSTFDSSVFHTKVPDSIESSFGRRFWRGLDVVTVICDYYILKKSAAQSVA